ncbi:unnamed protein product [Rotaria sordida]|uniref:HAT C-terminal dimerisation domain-containing protein n=1 Tax=Rotaria sordida TaxID=392033 RepID=A0A818L3T2_9BILA|nr:unnamed protein product [Rotaria sordida]CAF3566159.1 unnamed protein product [Rotaria sordida]CAF3960916.1 unnamed protein product [Rotaria sordida]
MDEQSVRISKKIEMKNYSSDVLRFWKRNADELLYLSKVARQMHSIPATTARIEVGQIVIPPPTPFGKICANLKMISQFTSNGDVQEYVFI